MSTTREQHWNSVYATRAATEVSWFQEEPATSLAMIAESGVGRNDALVDVGGGASRLVDRLVTLGYGDVTVLDIAETALAVARVRLGAAAARVTWTVCDVTLWDPPPGRYRLWHDRAVFHFLTEDQGREGYLRALGRGLQPGGFVILAPFAPTGPERCSGLPVRRYSAEELQTLLGSAYRLRNSRPETHVTPAGNRQDFVWCLFEKVADGT